MTILPWIAAAPLALVAGLALFSAWTAAKIGAALPAQGRWVDVRGGRIHYVAMGPVDAGGPPLVMIHGIMGQLRHFSYALAGRMAKDHRVWLIDRPGWGHSTLSGPRPGIGRQADMIAEAIGRLGIDRPVLVGHSMGGAVSLALAVRHPGTARALALIAPYAQPVEKAPDAFRGLIVAPALAPLIGWTLSVPVGMRAGAAAAAQAFAPDPVPADFGIEGGGLLSLTPAAFQSGAFEIRTGGPEMAALVPRYGELALPVSILYGRGDSLLDPALHGEKTAAAIRGAKLTLIDGGHMLQLVHPDATEAWLREAEAALPGRGSA